MDKKKLSEALSKILQEKGKRKFIQSVELIINTRSVDFSKSENRVNLDVALTKGRGEKQPKIGVIAEEAIANQAKKAGADLIIAPNELPNYTSKQKLKDIARNYVLLAQPNLMAQVAKNLGQYLGPRGKLPKPIIGNVNELIDRSRRSVRIVSKGKFLPVLQSFVGTEKMNIEDLSENVEDVYEAIKNRISEGNIKSVYLKLSMGKPERVA